MADETKPPGDPKGKPDNTAKDAAERARAQENLNKLLEDEASIKKELAEYQNQTVKAYKSILRDGEGRILLATKEQSLLETKIKRTELFKELGAILNEDQLTYLNTLEAQLVEVRKLAKAGEIVRDGLNDINASATHVLGSFFGINSKVENFAKGLQRSGKLSSYLKDQMKLVGEKLTNANIKAGLMLNLYEKAGAAAKQIGKWTAGPVLEAVDLTAAMDRAIQRSDSMKLSSREVGRLTVKEMKSFHSEMVRLGKETDGTTEDFERLTKTLYKSSGVFRELTLSGDSARESFQKVSQTLERRFNIAAGDTSNFVDKMSRSMGLGAEETLGMAQSLVVLGKDMGLNVQEMLPGMTAQFNNLAKFGLPDIEHQFLKLAKVSQLTGIGMDSIVGSMEKFTTFEGALNAASKLNAVFGSTIDGLELMDTVMEKGPIEGFIQLREQMEANGIEMDNLNYGEMRAMGESLGMTAEQIKAFGELSVDEFRKTTAGAMSAAEAVRRIQEDRKKGNTDAEKQKDLQDQMTTAMHDAAKAVLEMRDSFYKLGEYLGIFAGILTGIGSLFATAVLAKIVQVILKNTLLAASYAEVGAAAKAAALAQASSGATAGRAARGFGLLAKGIGAAAGAYGLYKSVEAGREAKDRGEHGKAAAISGLGGAASGALMGASIGSVIPGLGTVAGGALGAVVGGAGSLISTFMAPGQNYTSQPTQTLIGDSLGSETVTKRTQAALGTGDKVATNAPAASAGPTELNLTINLVTKEGKTLATQTISNQMSHGALGPAVLAVLDEKMNLIFG